MADTIPTTFTVPLAEYTRLAAERDALAARLAEAERKIRLAIGYAKAGKIAAPAQAHGRNLEGDFDSIIDALSRARTTDSA